MDGEQQDDALKAARKNMKDKTMMSAALSLEESLARSRENKANEEAEAQEKALASLGAGGEESSEETSEEVDEEEKARPRQVDDNPTAKKPKSHHPPRKSGVKAELPKSEASAASPGLAVKRELGESASDTGGGKSKKKLRTEARASEGGNGGGDGEQTKALSAHVSDLKSVAKRFGAGGYDDSKGRTMQSECKAIKELCESAQKEIRALATRGWSRSDPLLTEATDLVAMGLKVRNFVMVYARDGTFASLSQQWAQVSGFATPSHPKAEQLLMSYLRFTVEPLILGVDSRVGQTCVTKAMRLADTSTDYAEFLQYTINDLMPSMVNQCACSDKLLAVIFLKVCGKSDESTPAELKQAELLTDCALQVRMGGEPKSLPCPYPLP